MSGALVLVAVACSGVAAAAAAGLFVPPTPRLAPRVRPYLAPSRALLSVRPGATRGGVLRRVFGPLLDRVGGLLATRLDPGGDEVLLLRLRQARLFPDIPTHLRIHEYRVRQLGSSLGYAAALGAVVWLLGAGNLAVLGTALLGLVAGVARAKGRLDRAIEARRERMRIELYTVNQLLAMHIRVGGGVVQALQRLSERGEGDVVEELRDVLRWHRGGRALTDALQHAAKTTPEPQVARTYRLLSGGLVYGADLADGLRALSEDLRDQRLEAMKRTATRRRGAMLIPIIAILAPVMLLFVAAPLPSLVFGAP